MKAFGDEAPRRRWWPPTLLTRIALALLGVGVVPLAIVSFQLIRINRDALDEQVLRSHLLAAHATAERIGSFVSARSAAVAAGAAREEWRRPQDEAAQRLAAELLGSWSLLGALAVVVEDSDGVELLRAQYPSGPARVAFDRAGPPGRDRVRLVVDGTEPPLLVLATASEQGPVSLRACFDATEMAQQVRPEELGSEADLLVVDREHRLVVGSPQVLAEFPSELVDAAVSGRTSGVRRSFRSAAGASFLGAYSPVEGVPWAVVSREPTRVAEAASLRMRDRAILVLGLVLVLAGAFGASAFASIVRPLRRLLSASGGEGFDGSGTGSEIRQLERAFDSLRNNLHDREALSRVFLGRYQVLDLLGSGGMGAVFRGWDPKLERPVALKTVRPDRELSDSARTRSTSGLVREAVTVARFSHPNVVAVYDVVEAPSGAFIAMELVEGASLEVVLWGCRTLQPNDASIIGLAVARALAIAHEHQIVHRDVKPGNVLLGRDGSIKVTDYGVAALVSAAGPSGEGTILGTPGFIPPEVYDGEPYEARGDLYALGVLLYLTLAGQQPHRGKSPVELARRARLESPRPLRELEPELPVELEELVMALLARRPEQRPAGAEQVVRALDAVIRARAYQPTWPDLLPTQPARLPLTPTVKLTSGSPASGAADA